MAKSKYDDHLEIIMELHSEGKKATEIANILNLNPDVNIEADESGIRSFIKRSQIPKDESGIRSFIKRSQIPKDESVKVPPDTSGEKIKHLSGLLEKMEKNNSFLQKEAVAQGKLLNNLENIKVEYEEIIEKYSILNDTLYETITITKEDNSRKKMYYMIAAGWILTMLFAMFAGYYIGRCYSRTAFLYILTLTGIPAGVLIGIGLCITQKKLSKSDDSDVHAN